LINFVCFFESFEVFSWSFQWALDAHSSKEETKFFARNNSKGRFSGNTKLSLTYFNDFSLGELRKSRRFDDALMMDSKAIVRSYDYLTNEKITRST
jgi:hypothetical protein